MDIVRAKTMMRQSNIELCRILSMFMIVMLHSTYASFGYPEDLSKSNLLVLLFSSLSIMGADVFLLITGYFSASIKKKSICNLLYVCLFAGIVKVVLATATGTISWKLLFFVSKSNWYIICYIGLLIITPILNTFISNTSKKQLGRIIIAFYLFSFYFSILPAQSAIEPGFHNGCSVLWFLEVYLIGRYLRLYGFPNIFTKYSLVIYLLCVILIFGGQLALVKFDMSKKLPWFGAQNQPLVLISAISFFGIFYKLNFTSKVINYIAQSTLMVLLIHSPSLTKNYFIHITNSYTVSIAIGLWILGLIVVYLLCIIVDQLRLFSFKQIYKLITNQYTNK